MNVHQNLLFHKFNSIRETRCKILSVFNYFYSTNVSQIFNEEIQSNVASQGNSRLYIYGNAEHGALGYTTQVGNKRRRQNLKQYFKTPTRLHFGHFHKVSDIACGYGFTLIATKSKDTNLKIFGCGLNSDSQIGYHDPTKRGTPLELILSLVRVPLPFKHKSTRTIALAAGRAHTAIVTDKEGVFTFGNNAYGQCGRGIVEGEDYHRKWFCHKIEGVDGEAIVDAVCGRDHTMFLTETGRVFSCGRGADGQTGLGHFNNQDTPSLVRGDIEGEKIVKLSCTVDSVLAINDKGEVFGWGNSECGQISETEMQINEPRFIPHCKGLSRIVDVASASTSCAIVNDEGQVYSWGYGILGRGPKVLRSLKPGPIPSTLFGQDQFNPEYRVVRLTAGVSTFAAVTNLGQLYMWGRNSYGQLGQGTLTDQHFPLKVAVGADVHKVCSGVDHTLVLSKHFVS